MLDGWAVLGPASRSAGGWELVKAGAPGVDGIAAWFGTDTSGVETVGIDARVTASSFCLPVGGARSGKAPRGESRDAVWADRPAMPSSMLEAASSGVCR